MAAEYVDVEFFCEEWVLVKPRREAPVLPLDEPSTTAREHVVHVCDFCVGQASLFGAAQNSVPYYDAWEREYANEATLRSFGKKRKAKEGAEGPVVLPDMDPIAVRAAAAGATPRRAPSAAAGLGISKQMRSREDQEAELQRLADQKRKWEELETERKRAMELQEMAERDPMRAQREWERDQKKKEKRSREQAGEEGEGSGKAPKKKKEKEPGSAGGDVVALKANVAEVVMKALKPFLVEGRIADRDSFKHLSRKLVKELVQKEEKRGNTRWHPKLAAAMDKFVLSYMDRLKGKGVACYKKK